MNFRKTASAAALGVALATSPALADGFAEPLMEPEVIEEQAAASGGFVLPLLLLALLIAIAAGSDGVPLA